ncbi:MAG: lycopene cyclase family protein [Myxococcota bacterium]
MSHDVLVIGAGPAGLAICAALAERGADVACLAPEHPSPWPNNYGVWKDEVESLGISRAFEEVWERPIVFTGDSPRELDRSYVRFDNDLLRGHFFGICEDHGVTWVEGLAHRVDLEDDHSVVWTKDRDKIGCKMVVDASGHQPVLVERSGDRKPGFQAAYGFVGEFTESPIGEHDMVLMDYRDDYGADGDDVDEASFLYAMRLDEDRVFIEETSLVGRPPMNFTVLEDRLARRLNARGVDCTMVHEVERCLIPMGLPLPDLDQRVVGFGGAASMVHPATGYQMARMLNAAGPLADTIVESFESGVALDEASRRAWRTLWPEEAVRARRFWNFGMESLISLDPNQTRRFFDAFFDLNEDSWKAYMSGTLSPDAIPRVMWRVFKRAGHSLRFSLARSALTPDGLSMFRALLGSSRRNAL